MERKALLKFTLKCIEYFKIIVLATLLGLLHLLSLRALPQDPEQNTALTRSTSIVNIYKVLFFKSIKVVLLLHLQRALLITLVCILRFENGCGEQLSLQNYPFSFSSSNQLLF